MTDPLDGHDPHLGERMERAVGGLRAPDVADRAIARGRRRRTHRRLAQGAGGVAAVTALALAVPAFAGDWPGATRDPATPGVATDPSGAAPPSRATTTTPPATGGSDDEPCGASETGWWSASTARIRSDLSALLPAGVRVGSTNGSVTGEWRGRIVTGDGASYANLTLLPPPGVLGPRRTLAEVSRLGPCGGGANTPWYPVGPCDEITGDAGGSSEQRADVVACDEIRSDDGGVVGVVVEQAQLAVVEGQEQPSDETGLVAVAAGPGGGHVELVVGDSSALTTDQVRAIVAAPGWTG